MRGVLYVLNAWSGRRRAALAGAALLGAASLGFVLLAGLGARRSATAWDSLRERARGEDAILDVTSIHGARRVAEAAGRVPGVARALPMAYSRIVPEGREEDFLGGAILTLAPGGFESLWRPVITQGRRADQGQIDEVMVNDVFLDVAGLRPGDRFTMVDPFGLIRQPVTIVGVGVLPNEFTLGAGYPVAYPTSAFTRRWDTELQGMFDAAGNKAIGPSVFIARAAGADAGEVRERLTAAIPAEELTGVSDVAVTEAQVVDTLQLQRDGFLALAVVGGLAALAMLGLVLVRVTRLGPSETTALTALGFTRGDLRLGMLVPAGLAAGAALLGATLVLVLGHGLVPTGLAKRVGVGRDLGDDFGFLAFSVLGTAAALAALVTGIASGAARRAGSGPRPRRSGPALLTWPSVAVGVRSATGGLAAAGRRQASAAFAAVAIASLGIVSVGVIVDSREGLRRHLSRAGKFFDVYLYSYTDPAMAELDRDRLRSSNSVTGLATIDSFRARVDGLGVAGISVTTHKGGLGTTILDGRLPAGDDELVASAPFLRRLGRSVGDTVDVSGPAGARQFRVVGAAVLPYVASTAVIGEQVAMTANGRAALGIDSVEYTLAADVSRPEMARDVRSAYDRLEACNTEAILGLLGVERLEGPATSGVSLCVPRSDQRVADLDELGALPGAIVGLFAVLGAVGLAYLSSASFRDARRDLAVLRVLGFTRRQAVTAVLVQAGAVGLGGSLLALPVGVALGRAAWRGVAEELGVAVVPEASLIGTLGVVAGAVVVASLLAAPFAARSVARSPAQLLRAE